MEGSSASINKGRQLQSRYVWTVAQPISTRGVSYSADLYGRYLSLQQQGVSGTAQICMDGTSASTRGVSYRADLYGRYLSLNKGRQLQSRSVWTVPQPQQGASVTEQICMDGTSASTRGVSYSADLYGRYLSLNKGRQLQSRSEWTVPQPQQGASVTAQICMDGSSASINKGRQLQSRSVWTVPQPQQGASVTEQICMDGTSASINKGRQLQRRSVWTVPQPPTTRGVSYSADLYGR